MDKNILLILALIVGLVLGYGFASLKTKEAPTKEEIRKELVQELRDTNFLSPAPEEIMEVSGTVKEVSKDKLTLETEQRFDDPLGEFIPKTVVVKTTGETKIYKIKEKSPEVLEKEKEEFNKKLQQYEEAGEEVPPELMLPEPFTREEINLAEIKKGGRVFVTSSENIKGKSEFTAATIEIEAVEIP